MKDNKGLCAIYVRVSTEDQKQEGFSIDNQIEKLSAFANEKGWIFKIYNDAGYSAKNLHRPALTELINNIQDSLISKVLIFDLDRLTRSIRDQENIKDLLRQYNVELWCPNQKHDILTADGDFNVALFGILAQRERKKTSERVQQGMKKRAMKGLWNGGDPPYGYTSQRRIYTSLLKQGKNKEVALSEAVSLIPEPKKLFIDEKEVEIVKTIYDKYINEGLGAVKIAEFLNINNCKPRRKDKWSVAVIMDLINKPIYCGLIRWNRHDYTISHKKRRKRNKEDIIVVEGIHEPIISKELWDKAQATKESNKNNGGRKKYDYVLSKTIYCGSCNKPMVGRSEGKRGNWQGYICSGTANYGRSFCDFGSVNKIKVEEAVLNYVNKIITHPSYLDEILWRTNQRLEDKVSFEKEITKTNSNIKSLENSVERYYDAFEQGHLEADKLAHRVKAIEEQIEEERKNLEGLRNRATISLSQVDINKVRKILSKFDVLMGENRKKDLIARLKDAYNFKVIALEKKKIQVGLELPIYQGRSNGGNERVSLRYVGTDTEPMPVKFMVVEVIEI